MKWLNIVSVCIHVALLFDLTVLASVANRTCYRWSEGLALTDCVILIFPVDVTGSRVGSIYIGPIFTRLCKLILLKIRTAFC